VTKLDELKQTFFDECDEALQQIEAGLTAIREGEQTAETIHAIFRGVHSVKGGAGIFGFQALVEFAHAFETVLDLLRHEKISQSEATLNAMLSANDVLFDLIRLSRSGEAIAPDFGVENRKVLDAIAGGDSAVAVEATAPADFDDIEFTPVMVETETNDSLHEFAIEIRPRAGASISAITQVKEIAEAAGDCTLDPDLSGLSPLQAFEPGKSFLKWKGTLRTALDQSAIDLLFEPVREQIDVLFIRLGGPVVESVPDFVVDHSTLPVEAPVQPLSPAVEQAPGQTPQATTASQAPETKPAKQAATTTRIELEKIDRAVNLVGELVIAQAMLGQIVTDLPEQTSSRLMQTVQEVIHHTRELKDSVMSMRAQAVGSVFQRMPRLVRELSAKTGKKVRLELSGEKTEVDRSIIERLSDPLTHIIRNSVDHGIEQPEDRAASGKDEEGTIRLSAEHRGGRIVIEIRDDGAGVNSDRVLKKALERGLVKPNTSLSEDEINGLIMLPGFSTAEALSDISGRGVGMDVVRASITEIGGRVSLKSERGRGMTIQLSLPLTLAVMDGMVIKVAQEIYVMPLSTIIECLLPDRAVIANLVGTHGVLQLRGEHIPLLRLADLFGLQETRGRNEEQVVIVSDIGDGRRIGLVVDELCGHQQVVIKSIEESYGTVPGIAAATILGNGRVAFILDVEKLPGITSQTPLAARQPQAA
jgi:two-component system chemotaxis sensor kinase CheA